jgi:hypothetical protein
MRNCTNITNTQKCVWWEWKAELQTELSITLHEWGGNHTQTNKINKIQCSSLASHIWQQGSVCILEVYGHRCSCKVSCTYVQPEQVKWLTTLPQYFPVPNVTQTHYTVIKLLHATDEWNKFKRHFNRNMLKKEEEFKRRRPTSTSQSTHM